MLLRGRGAAPERGHVVTAAVGLGAARAERAAARVDDLRVHGAHVVDLDAELPAGGGQQRREEHVGAANQIVEHLATRVGADVDADAALAAVRVLEVHVDVGVGHERAGAHQAALRIAGHGVFDLDHVRAPVGQHAAGRGDEAPHRYFDDAHTLHRLLHAGWSPFNVMRCITRLWPW